MDQTLETGMNSRGLFIELNNGEYFDPNVHDDGEDSSSVLISVLNQSATASKHARHGPVPGLQKDFHPGKNEDASRSFRGELRRFPCGNSAAGRGSSGRSDRLDARLRLRGLGACAFGAILRKMTAGNGGH